MSDTNFASFVDSLIGGTTDTFLVCAGTTSPVAKKTAAEVRSLLGVYTTAQVDSAVATKIGGSVGSTTNRLIKSSGTDTLTVQSTGITVDASNNVSGVGTISSGAIAASGFSTVAQTGASGTAIEASGRVTTTFNTALITQGQRWVGTDGVTYWNVGNILSSGNSRVQLDASLAGANQGRVNLGAGYLYVEGGPTTNGIRTFGNLSLSPAALGGSGSVVVAGAITASGAVVAPSFGSAVDAVLTTVAGRMVFGPWNGNNVTCNPAVSGGSLDFGRSGAVGAWSRISFNTPLQLGSTGSIGFSALNPWDAPDVRYARGSSGTANVLSNAGVSVRNFADSADAPLTAGAITANGAWNLAPITKSALLLLTPNAATGGRWRVTDATPPNRAAYPTGTDWRYTSDDTVVT